MNRSEFLKKVKQTVKGFDQKAEVRLFGSRARGDFREDSDWDFLILTSMEATEEIKDQVRKLFYYIELESEQLTNTLIRAKETWEKNYSSTLIYKYIQQDGILL